jgi:hypothetical protein
METGNPTYKYSIYKSMIDPETGEIINYVKEECTLFKT